MAQYSLFVLKVPFNPNQANKQTVIALIINHSTWIADHHTERNAMEIDICPFWRINRDGERTQNQQEQTEPEPTFSQEPNRTQNQK